MSLKPDHSSEVSPCDSRSSPQGGAGVSSLLQGEAFLPHIFLCPWAQPEAGLNTHTQPSTGCLRKGPGSMWGALPVDMNAQMLSGSWGWRNLNLGVHRQDHSPPWVQGRMQEEQGVKLTPFCSQKVTRNLEGTNSTQIQTNPITTGLSLGRST